jgi:hypothetical protein
MSMADVQLKVPQMVAASFIARGVSCLSLIATLLCLDPDLQAASSSPAPEV